MITHNIKEGTLGKYIILYDTTTLQEYTNLGIDVNTNIVSVTFIFTFEGVEYSTDVTSSFDNLRDVNGFEIQAEDLISTSIPDGIYDTRLEIVENSTGTSVTHTSELTVVFYENIKYKTLSGLKKADWTEYFNNYKREPLKSIKCFNWLLNLEYTANLKLFNEADKILKALQRSC